MVPLASMANVATDKECRFKPSSCHERRMQNIASASDRHLDYSQASLWHVHMQTVGFLSNQVQDQDTMTSISAVVQHLEWHKMLARQDCESAGTLLLLKDGHD